ncbi:MAG: hypothetical protein VYA34_03055 [Myxococcota bacterium]|nr:hypothetical protein [Myxococcota bacterium]
MVLPFDVVLQTVLSCVRFNDTKVLRDAGFYRSSLYRTNFSVYFSVEECGY